MGICTAEDHVFNFSRIKLRHLGQNLLNAMRREVIRPRQVKRPAKRLGQWRPRAGNDNGFSHERLILANYNSRNLVKQYGAAAH